MHKEGMQLDTIAVIVCISAKKGIEDYSLKPISIKKLDIIDILKDLKTLNIC
jgi:hypothetical protein